MGQTNQQNVSTAVNTAILASIGVAVGNRVFDLKIPDETALPLCRYQIIIDENVNMLNCSEQNVTLQVNLFGKANEMGIKALRTISDTLFNDLKNTQLTIADVAISNTINGIEQGIATLEEVEEEDIINIRQEYSISIQ